MTRWRVLPFALAAAVVGALLAPSSWQPGHGTLEVELDGVVSSRAMIVGSTEELRLENDRLEVVLPNGVPQSGTVRAQIEVKGEEAAALDSVKVTLVLPGGERELVPVLMANRNRLEAARRAPDHSATVLGLLGLVVVLWVTEAIPLFVTSLLVPVILVFMGAASARAALAPFFDPVIALFFGGFLMAEAMRRVELDKYIAVSLVARAGRGPVSLFAALIGVSAFMSMWMSNTASTALLVPIAIAVTDPLGNLGYRKAVVLGIAYAATVGGVGSAIGTPANPIAIRFLRDFVGTEISFVGWFAYGLPMVVLFLPVMGVVLWRRAGVRLDRTAFDDARRVAMDELARLGRPNRDQLVVLAVFAGVVALWLTQQFHHFNTGIIAVAGAVALALLGKIGEKELTRISWSALITFGGGLALGTFLTHSGTSDWLATRLTGLSGLPPMLGVALVAVLSLALTAVASNTATAAMLVPLAIPLAGVVGVDPVLLVVVVAIASSVDFALVIGTPPTMIAYSTGLFTTREIFRTGILLDVAGIAMLVTAVIGAWKLLGLA